MKTVIFSCDKCIARELMELSGIDRDETILTTSHLQMINALRKHEFDQAILNIASNLDLILIKYISEHNQAIKIKLFGDGLLNEMIPIMQRSNCEVIRGGMDHEE